jgi:hypothetical protein
MNTLLSDADETSSLVPKVVVPEDLWEALVSALFTFLGSFSVLIGERERPGK